MTSLFPEQGKSYNPKICEKLTKNLHRKGDTRGENLPSLVKMPTFSPKMMKIYAGFQWQHNTKIHGYFPNYAVAYAPKRSMGEMVKTRKITVENHDFSTLSTGFSTGVFHKDGYTFWLT